MRNPGGRPDIPPVLRAHEGVGFWGWVVIAVVVNAIAWVPVFGAYGQDAGWVWLLIAIFPAIGLLAARMPVSLWKQLRLWGRATVTLDPPRPRVGEPFAATLRLEGATAPMPREWWAVLVCARKESGGERTRVDTLWREDVEGIADGATVRMVFTPGMRRGRAVSSSPPASSGPGDRRSAVRIEWRLLFWADGVDPPKQFEPEMGPPGGEPSPGAAALLEEAEANAGRSRDASATVSRLARRGIVVSARPAGGVIRQRPKRHRGFAVGLLLLGTIFGFGGFALLSTSFARASEPLDTWLVGSAIVIAAAIALTAGVYKLRHDITTTWDGSHIRVTWRHLLGRGIEEIERDRIASLVPVVRYSSGGDTSHTLQEDAIALLLVTDDGRKLPVADGITSRPDAEVLLDLLAGAWDIPRDRVGSLHSAHTNRADARNLVWRRTRPRALACVVGFAAALVLGAAALRLDFGGEVTRSFSVGGVELGGPGGGDTPRGQGAGSPGAAHDRRPARPPPPDPAALPGIPPGTDLSGDWTLSLPAGFERPATFARAGRDRYRLHAVGVFDGMYERRDGDLAMVVAADDRIHGFVWRGDGTGRLVLVATAPVGLTGQDYRGATLRRRATR